MTTLFYTNGDLKEDTQVSHFAVCGICINLILKRVTLLAHLYWLLAQTTQSSNLHAQLYLDLAARETSNFLKAGLRPTAQQDSENEYL